MNVELSAARETEYQIPAFTRSEAFFTCVTGMTKIVSSFEFGKQWFFVTQTSSIEKTWFEQTSLLNRSMDAMFNSHDPCPFWLNLCSWSIKFSDWWIFRSWWHNMFMALGRKSTSQEGQCHSQLLTLPDFFETPKWGSCPFSSQTTTLDLWKLIQPRLQFLR